MKNLIFITLITISTFSVFAQKKVDHNKNSLIHWLSFEEAIKKQKEHPKVIMIDMYTDWCGWCKKLDKTTFINPGIAEYINTFFYPVKFNGEGFDTLTYKGKKYINEQFDKNGKKKRKSTHPLAIELMKGKMSYPTTVYIDAKENVTPVPGYMSAKDIEPLLVWFSEKINTMSPYNDFLDNFKLHFSKDTVLPSNLVKWYKFEDAIEKCKKNPKKIYIYINSKFNHGGNIMKHTTLNNPIIAKYLNEKYYPVYLEAENTDTITVFGQTYINEQKAANFPHQLVISILDKKLSYPVSIFMNEKIQMINKIPGYLSPQAFEPISQYFGDNKMETEKFDDYRKNFKSKIPKSNKAIK